MSDSLLAELRHSADPDDRRVAGLLLPLAGSSGQLRMPAADEALTTFLVEQLGAVADRSPNLDADEPTLVVHLGPATADRPARRVGSAVLAAAAVVAVVTAVGAAAMTGLGQRDEGPVVVTPAVQTPTPATHDSAGHDPVAHPRATPAQEDGSAAVHRRQHGATGGPAAVVLPPAASGAGTGAGGEDRHGSTTAPSPTPTAQATGDDGDASGDGGSGAGSGDGSDDDATSVGTSGGGDDATPTPASSAPGEVDDSTDPSSSGR
jgi:hypothetical protein